MSNSILIPLQVYGLGFIISIFMAILIKVMMFTIQKFSKEDSTDKNETH